MVSDNKTARAFATSWNNLPKGSVYTKDQFVDWMEPLNEDDVRGKRVLELGCGNGSLMTHVVDWKPAQLDGVDLGDSVITARENLKGHSNISVIQNDLVAHKAGEPYDFVYCIGVLHHLQDPRAGFESVVRNTKPGGKFHCWVYAQEGNWVIIHMVDPIRKVASRLPWWFTKHILATGLVAPFFMYAKLLSVLPRSSGLRKLPLYDYSLWIGKREFAFFRHVAFDQLVTPQTAYLSKETITSWLHTQLDVKQESIYIIMRNGNSWKFGGTKK
jgi:SAM-dependent methyltransferase